MRGEFPVPPYSTSSVPVFKRGLMLRRVTIAVASVLLTVGTSWGQTSSTKPRSNAKQIHWHKYVNKEFGFSLWCPDTYRPSEDAEYCKDNDFRRYLICLERRDDSDTTIVVTIIIAQPFHVYPGQGDVMPARQQMGHHVFYCGLVGSMGTGRADDCVFNLKGKTLEFEFSPTKTVNSGKKTNPIASEVLKTLRTF
jgi:hypothetical protein